MRPRIRNGFLAAGAAALLSSQAVYAAPVSAIDPLVSLSALAGSASRAAVCAGSTAATAAASAAAQAAPAPGCVLPVNAAPPPPPVAEAPPPVVPVETGAGIGTWPLLLGLAAVAGIAALLLLNDDDDNGDTTPVSPA
ncbi:MAG TPA: hypothetical protein VFS69_05090 [Sphingomicrobium sp.]|nr:hypothetical protein [Sphingomicrobium sp.]